MTQSPVSPSCSAPPAASAARPPAPWPAAAGSIRALARRSRPPPPKATRRRRGLGVGRPATPWTASASVAAGANGVTLILHAVNPPGYRNWGTLVLPMIDNTIAAAQGDRRPHPAAGHDLQLSGRTPIRLLREDSAAAAWTSPQVEIRMAHGGNGWRRRLRRACAPWCRGPGDFFGPRPPRSSWFSQRHGAKPGQPGAGRVPIPSPARRRP